MENSMNERTTTDDTTFPNRQSTGTGGGSAQSMANDATGTARRTLDQARETIGNVASTAREKMGTAASAASERLGGAATYTKERAQAAVSATQGTIQKAPVSSVMVALGAGIVIGWLLADRFGDDTPRPLRRFF
jgi:ElaB/YqjD/DUF883 family membrane-anchored ribosome-binding protein